SEMFPWLRSAWRKVLCAYRERAMLGVLTRALHKRFFLVPLQISVDSQVRQHSDFRSVAPFIRHVVSSFAAGAPPAVALLFTRLPASSAASARTSSTARPRTAASSPSAPGPPQRPPCRGSRRPRPPRSAATERCC